MGGEASFNVTRLYVQKSCQEPGEQEKREMCIQVFKITICSKASPNLMNFKCICVMGLSSVQSVEPVPDEFLQRPGCRLSTAAPWDHFLPFIST